MSEKPKRSWFRFSLRTMFVVVTVFGVWLGWNLKIVRERKAILVEMETTGRVVYQGVESTRGGYQYRVEASEEDVKHIRISPVRRLLGDETCYQLIISSELDPKLIERAENAFPEAIFLVDTGEFRDSLLKPVSKRMKNEGTLFKTGLIEK